MTEIGSTPPASAGHSPKRIAVAVAAAAVVLAGGGGAFAVVKMLDGGGTQPAEVLPASVVAYARLDVDPSASQKIALLKLIRKFPDAAKSLGIKSPDQDVRELLLKDAIAGCGLTYNKDIKPWIGSRLGVALLKDAKTPIVAVQVSDEAKARKGLTNLLTKCADSPKPGIAFLHGYALVTEKPGAAADVRAAAQKAPLSENRAFIADNKALGGEGFASAWVTTKAFASFLSLAGPNSGIPAGIDKQVLGKGSTALSLRATSDSLELQSVGKAQRYSATQPSGIADLPADTALAFGAAFGRNTSFDKDFKRNFERGFGQGFGQGLNQPGAPSIDPRALLNEVESQSGLKIPQDLETLLGDRLSFAVGSKNLETVPTLAGPDDLAGLNIGLAMHTDPGKAMDLAKRLSALAARVGVHLTVAKSADGAVIATNPEAAKMFDGTGKLGDKGSFKRVIPDSTKATSAFYVDVAAILEAVAASNPPKDVSSLVDQLKAISAIGFSTSTIGDYTHARGRITFTR